MSFFKSLCLAIFATIFLTYVLGVSFIELLDVDIYMGEQVIEPLKAISVSALVVVLLVLVAFAIAMSVFGSIIFVAMLVLGGGAMLLVGVFWPVFLIAGVIWLLARDKRPVHC
ncbi:MULTISPECIES: hypothetical protein [unclassified Colwellia]|jgi:hypothetical protein|uniref:hypothetical protein n=1 Tax=unclassified Colwellia TaxID=196834 RepID=UPI000D3D8BE7|nr:MULTISPECIES: hypothetical protein [unclassified Colwellia]AWB56475.1 hypothetical protein DBO93_02090 [Colwellia sp. Arc7-D]MBA6415390.1 hypothetical protein [Colwellia sp. 6M3]|tara:strand:+ start:9503 stop:9841 length:339 start_codon:yes stop_codon:yes gene_type:complete